MIPNSSDDIISSSDSILDNCLWGKWGLKFVLVIRFELCDWYPQKRGVDVPKAKGLENLSKSDLGYYQHLFTKEVSTTGLVLDALSYPENTPDEEPQSNHRCINWSLWVKGPDGLVRVRHNGGVEWVLVDDAIEGLVTLKILSENIWWIQTTLWWWIFTPQQKQFISASGIRKGSSTTECYGYPNGQDYCLPPRGYVQWLWLERYCFSRIYSLGCNRVRKTKLKSGYKRSRQVFWAGWKDELGHQDVHKTFYLSRRQQSQLAKQLKKTVSFTLKNSDIHGLSWFIRRGFLGIYNFQYDTFPR